MHAVNLAASPVTLYKGMTIANFSSLAAPNGPSTAEYKEIPLTSGKDELYVHQVGVEQSPANTLEIDASTMNQYQREDFESLVLEFADMFIFY